MFYSAIYTLFGLKNPRTIGTVFNFTLLSLCFLVPFLTSITVVVSLVQRPTPVPVGYVNPAKFPRGPPDWYLTPVANDLKIRHMLIWMDVLPRP